MLPVQMLSGYPYIIYDEDSLPCIEEPFFIHNGIAVAPRLFGYFPSYKNDVYSTFKVRHRYYFNSKLWCFIPGQS